MHEEEVKSNQKIKTGNLETNYSVIEDINLHIELDYLILIKNNISARFVGKLN